MTMRYLVLLALVVAACNGSNNSTDSRKLAADKQPLVASAGVPSAAINADSKSGSSQAKPSAASMANESASAAAAVAAGSSAVFGASASVMTTNGKPQIVRGLYVNRFAAQSRKKMGNLIALADTTEINAFVIDIKDEFGINYKTADSLVARNAGRGGAIPELRALLDTLKAHCIMPIARIVAFKDSVTARVNPAWTIRKDDGSAWRDREGLAWVNPYNHELWDYNIRIAEEVVKLGFQEIQWDYIRFPEPYKSLPQQVFPGANGVAKTEALAAFLTEARTRLTKVGVASTADIFGLVTTVNGTLEIGQKWEPLARTTDVLLPMVYPSHYPRGAFGTDRPNAEPYKVVYAAISRAHDRNIALGITGEAVRPWLQAFTLGQPVYGPEQLAEQKRAVYDAGFDGWILWHPGSKYEAFIEALEPRLESRKKPYPVVAHEASPPK